MKITARIRRVAEQYRASEALVLPVDAQAARVAPTKSGVAEGRRHAVVFETARRVHAFVLQEQSAGRAADVSGHAFGRVQQRLAFAHGDALLKGNKGQQFVEPPDAAETMRIGAPGPFFFEMSSTILAPADDPNRRPHRPGCRIWRSQPEFHRWNTLHRRRAQYIVDRQWRILKWYYLLNDFK